MESVEPSEEPEEAPPEVVCASSRRFIELMHEWYRVPMSPEQHRRLRACEDQALLHHWMVRAAFGACTDVFRAEDSDVAPAPG